MTEYNLDERIKQTAFEIVDLPGGILKLGNYTDSFKALLREVIEQITPEPSTYFKQEFITDNNRALNEAYLHGQEHYKKEILTKAHQLLGDTK